MGKRHSKEVKQEALEYFRQGFGSHATARIMGLSAKTVENWHNHYRAGNLEWVTSSYMGTDSSLPELFKIRQGFLFAHRLIDGLELFCDTLVIFP